MARGGWLADNEHRAYPLTADRPPTMTRSDSVDVDLPTSVLVDFQVVMGITSQWRPDVDTVFLHSVSCLDDGSFLFEFRTTALGLANDSVFFSRAPDAAEFMRELTEVIDAATGSVGGSAGSENILYADCEDTLIWSATLTTGTMLELAAVLAPGQMLTAADGLMLVEPALVQDIGKTYVNSINVANHNRLHVTAPPGCPAVPLPMYPDDTYIMVEMCVVGDIEIQAGFNCNLTQNDQTNTLTLAAGVGAGAGTPCGEVPVYPAEVPPDGSELLTGGPTCAQTVSSINGMSASNITILPAGAVSVTTDQASSTVTVSANLASQTMCLGGPISSSSHGSSER